MTSLAGTALHNRYELLTVMHRGRFADVWEGFDTRLARPVAVKLARLDHNDPASELVREQFRREATVPARFSHPNLVSTFDVGIEIIDESPQPYIVMEKILGTNLREVSHRHAFTEQELTRFGLQLLDACHYLHERQCIHRDIKPSNVMLIGNPSRADSRIVLIDFGLLTKFGDDIAFNGQVAGTAAYCAPELLRGSPAQPSFDLYAIGALLYDLATSVAPTIGESETQTIRLRISSTPLPARTVQPELGAKFAQVIDKSVARDIAERFESTAEFATALHAVLGNGAPKTEQIPREIIPSTATTSRSRGVRFHTDPSLNIEAEPTPVSNPLLKRRRDPQPSRSKTPLVVFAIVAAVVAAAIALIVTSWQISSPEKTTKPSTVALSISDIQSFDPFGDNKENDAQLPRLLDNDLATTWRSSTYKSPAFGGLKPGLGLVIETSAPARLLLLRNVSTGAPYQVFTWQDQADPRAMATWGPELATGNTANETAIPLLRAPQGNKLLLWITQLPAGNRIEIGTIEAKGTQ